ncbi:MAG TPA: hypothetical protein VLB44_06690, partial [Kofleriaceae bacterium]|nr:hypothetical protein [Kofleriaceae bacterium]
IARSAVESGAHPAWLSSDQAAMCVPCSGYDSRRMLRVGELRALDWRRDVDLVAGTITVNKQTRQGQMTSC